MNEKRNIRLILEYDGGAYHGWQRQKKDLTIQDVLEDRIQIMVGERVTLLGSGRTDAGVHALYQACNYFTSSNIDPESMRRGLNSLLPDDIYIKQAEYMHNDFHSRYSAKSKTYEYRILNRFEPDIFLRRVTWHVRRELDHAIMRKCMSMLLGKNDFAAFRSTGSENRTTIKELTRSELHGPDRDGILCFLLEANGFLRHMVRNIVGTVVEVGKGRWSLDEFEEIFRSRDRCRAGIKAPCQGLFLKDVVY
ncbi:MAG: tRNA pseudouridine(38-40) synthase TruA [Deltaproteobacteria bacterium]|nr:tRNA pseudouridine(38-40) synthase TruA [Deltaproteobacteria bacterium]